MIFVKLTLSSNGLPTFINVETINQIYEDTDKDGKSCTRIEFENDFTRVSETMKIVMLKIAKAKLNTTYGNINTNIKTCIGCYTDTDFVKSEEK